MNTLCPDESVSSNSKRVIMRELVQGREAATKLKLLLQNPIIAEGSLSVKELAANVLRSFTESLCVLTSDSSSEQGCSEGGKNLVDSGEDWSPAAEDSGNDPRSEGSVECMKRSLIATKNGGRGCYKRRRAAHEWTIVSATADDNHAWRKYGQKDILNSKFPRSYFRCSRKHDQGCPATKQVQRTQENPDMYQTTYIGVHTCKATPKAPYLVVNSITLESFLVDSHHDSNVSNEQDDPISPPTPTIIKEQSKEDTPSDVTDHKLDPTVWSNLKDFEPSKASILPREMGSDNAAETVYSCSGSQSLNMDFRVDSVHFGTDYFHLGDSHELI